MIHFSKAKINIGLNITERRADGYHNIESVFYPIPLVDILEINLAENFSYISTGLKIDGKLEDNLIIKAYQLLRKVYNIGTVQIHLHKQIPMGAGLGGGSSNASSTLILLNQLFDLKIETHVLEELALTIGSDCPFFIKNQAQYVSGRGELLLPIDFNLKGYYLYLINPGIHISTKQAYSGIELKSTKQNLVQLIESSIDEWSNLIKNDFETHLFKTYPDLDEIKRQFYKDGALYASMTGSGSTMYGLFIEPPVCSAKYPLEQIIKL